MSWLKKLIQKTVIGGSTDLTGKILGISNDSLFNNPAAAAQAQAQKDADAAKAAADAQAAATNKAAEQNKLELANMQANSLALSNANSDNTSGAVASVIAGGYADAQDVTKKRKVQTQTLASSLGINI